MKFIFDISITVTIVIVTGMLHVQQIEGDLCTLDRMRNHAANACDDLLKYIKRANEENNQIVEKRSNTDEPKLEHHLQHRCGKPFRQPEFPEKGFISINCSYRTHNHIKSSKNNHRFAYDTINDVNQEYDNLKIVLHENEPNQHNRFTYDIINDINLDDNVEIVFHENEPQHNHRFAYQSRNAEHIKNDESEPKPHHHHSHSKSNHRTYNPRFKRYTDNEPEILFCCREPENAICNIHLCLH